MVANKVGIDIPQMFPSADAITMTLDNGSYVLRLSKEKNADWGLGTAASGLVVYPARIHSRVMEEYVFF